MRQSKKMSARPSFVYDKINMTYRCRVTYVRMNQYIEENGYRNDFRNGRLHHEIYMSDARKVAPENRKTVIRHPICKKEG